MDSALSIGNSVLFGECFKSNYSRRTRPTPGQLASARVRITASKVIDLSYAGTPAGINDQQLLR
jgi:hypothetical protein